MESLVEMSVIERGLMLAQTPEQTKEIEAIALAARAWAQESHDYEMLVSAVRVYILARRKTTELVQPYVRLGGNGSNQYGSKGNDMATLADFGFTKQQWNRRVRELGVTEEQIASYFDEVIAKGWNPSLFGMMRYARSNEEHYETASDMHYRISRLVWQQRKQMQLGGDPNYLQALTDKVDDIAGSPAVETGLIEAAAIIFDWLEALANVENADECG